MSATFVYKALDPRGGQLAGEVTGESKAAVAAQLRMRGLTVVDVDEKKSDRPAVGSRVRDSVTIAEGEGLRRSLLIGNAVDLADLRGVEVVGERELAHQKTSIALGA